MAMPKSFIPLKLLMLWHLVITQFTPLTLSLKLDANYVASERDALLSFKEGIIDPSRLLASWENQDYCSWRGVRCNNVTAHIIKLDLQGYQLQFHSGCGINSSLLTLEHLNYLDLSNNDFTGHRIPEFIGSFKNLKYLNLSWASFHGSIPPQLGNLSKLRYLDLSYNSLHSANLVAWLPHLSSLKHINMRQVNLSAAVDWVNAMSLLPASIRVLTLSGCSLNATLSSLPLYYSYNLTALVTLDLSYNYFHGPIPNRLLQNMTSLKELMLGGNYLVGTVPETLKNLRKLEMLDLWRNGISGDIKELIERLPRKIKSLFLGSNDLTGNLSWIEHRTGLRELDLGSNNLNGSIPFGMGKLTTLSCLDLSSNYLVGVISEDHFTNLTRLEQLDLSNNSLTIEVDPNWIPPFRLKSVNLSSCKLGPHFPSWIQSQTDITSLVLSNTGIADRLPAWFWNVISPIEHLDLSFNLISGELPFTLEFLSAARFISLNSNQFQGQVPQLPVGLWHLDLSRNHISGPLPPDLGYVELGCLLLSTNHISGTIPSSSMCNQLQSLLILDLSNNHLSGQFPQCWTSSTSFRDDRSESRLVGHKLVIINLSNNSLSGKFPLIFRGCQALQFLDISYNNFFGNLPAWIATRLPWLAFLLLKFNMFSGYIPVELVKLDHLQVLDLAHNNLSGIIAPSLMNFKAMTRISPYTQTTNIVSFSDVMEDDSFSLFVVTKGQILEYKTNIIYMSSLDLSSNNLIGEIPEQICAIVGLKNLNLSSNRLIGNIPQSISGLRSLESLDLSNNELSGEIPSTLSYLTYLSYLNLSYNSLSGRIPTEGQLETFEDPTIYEGNYNLCGPPTSKDCSGNGTTLSDPQEYKDEVEMSFFYLSMGLGFAMGFWVVLGSLLYKRTWRTAYFLFIDSIYDRIFVFMVLNWAKLIANIKEK